MLKNLIDKQGNLNKLITSIENRNAVSVFGLGLQEKVLILNEVEHQKLFVCANDDEAKKLHELLILENKKVGLLVSGVHTDVSQFSFSNNLSVLYTLQDLVLEEIEYLITTPSVIITKFPSKELVSNYILNIKINSFLNVTDLIKELVARGYKKTDAVLNHLDFSVKGDIVLVFPINYDYPIKISFFDDEVEFIKLVDVHTQATVKEVKVAKIYSANFLSNNKVDIKGDGFITREAEENFKNIKLQTLHLLESGIVHPWLFPFLQEFNNTLFSYFNNNIVVFDNAKYIIDVIKDNLINFNTSLKEGIEEGEYVKEHKNLYFNLLELFNFSNASFGLVAFQHIHNANNIFKPKAVFNIKTTPQLNYTHNKTTLYNDVAKSIALGNTVLIFAETSDYAQKLNEMLIPKNVIVNIINTFSQVQKNCVNLLTKSSSLTAAFNEEKLLIIGLKFKKATQLKAQEQSYNVFLPQVGDYVVHNNYGIGLCVSIKKLEVGGGVKDYIEIEYRGGDKLFLPVENIGSINKYIGGDKPKVHKLGSLEFAKTKQKVKDNIKKLTFNLKSLYAKRKEIKGIKFPEDDEVQLAFENSFSYDLTADQLTAIKDVKKDMNSTKAMDRLICGDVGFGKTEVALRAAFKAVMAGYQVMFLCPTTILSEQHYNTLLQRMLPFGVRIEVLNRFKSSKDVEKILSQLSSGEIDVICGTHRLLSNDVKLKNLGLFILDEEQRFGVEHKEKIKNLKNNIDVLTLSATPIPRTMHIALLGVKDISAIETAPAGRMSVITNVCEQSDAILSSAIMRELGREGQVLIVHNKIENIYEVTKHVRDLLDGEVVIDVAHGQMSEKALESAIYNLYSGKTQILISTTLIENGIDLPRANTLIVLNADSLGLGQLYQLKGRIGRSDRQAYAFFCYKKGKVLTEDAYKRLTAIVEYGDMGNGFKVAMRDLEIRGAGSLFGAEQSGYIESVGYSTYLSLLTEAIVNDNENKIAKASDVKIDCYFSAHLPNYYVQNASTRMGIYSDIAKIESKKQQSDFLQKLNSTHGEVPQEVENLIYVARIKNACASLPIARVSVKIKESSVYFDENNEQVLKSLTVLHANKSFEMVLSLQNMPIITIKNKVKLLDTLEYLIAMLKSIQLLDK